MFNVEKIFVTGASGFIGKHLCKFLLNKGHTVIAYSRSNPHIEGVEWIQGDILQSDKVVVAMRGCSVVIHLAAITPYNEIKLSPFEAYLSYEKGILNILEAVRQNNILSFVYPSSGKVYGRKNILPYDETQALFPDVLMGKMKHIAEKQIELFSQIYSSDAKFIVARIFNVYGPDQSNNFLIPKLVNSRTDEKIEIGSEEIRRDYIYIFDVISAFDILLDGAPCGFSVYNIASGQAISIKHILETVGRIANKNIQYQIAGKFLRDDERKEEYANIKKILQLGWKPRFSFEEGIEHMQKYVGDINERV